MALKNTHYGAERISDLLSGCKSVYFLGIGGINMSSLAHITHTRGYRVGGSDRTLSKLTERLSAEGIEIFEGHDEKNISGYDALVYTVAVSADNPEYICAKKRGIPCISRADYMGYIMIGYNRRIGISGMHGKSTCTSMCAEVLMAGQTDPTVLSGAELASMGGAWRIGGRENFLFEACEYMDSFLDFNPTVAVILNIEMDHVDYFKSMEQIRESYGKFASIAGKDGVCVINSDDGDVIEAVRDFEGKKMTFAINDKTADVRAEDIRMEKGRYCFSVICEGELYCKVALSVTGYHNIYNALAAAAVGYLCGLEGKAVKNGLAAFCGAKRRMEYKGECNGAQLYDDYGHHPTEVRTTLKGAKAIAEGRLFCVFQPHTYSRTSALFDDFADALRVADRVIVSQIYAARETDTLGVSAQRLAEAVGNGATASASFGETAEILKQELCEGDVAVIMGAGDVWRVFEYIKMEK
jgi:UDP-N-acetylmuramate--alanine ligase